VWISILNRGGRLIHVNGQTALQAGDEVLALADKMSNWTVCSPAQAAGE
jgi:NhaP-type Na+/H+ and K+/H+ antiporter